MLRGKPSPVDLSELRDRLLPQIAEDLKNIPHTVLNEEVRDFHYPIETYPEKIVSFNLDKTNEIKSRLLGIKGQYLIFESGVLNVRSHAGYEIIMEGSDGPTDNSP
jgi:hypothetical protein